MSSSDEELANAVTQNRGNTVMPQIEYRKMKALERIAEALDRLAGLAHYTRNEKGEIIIDGLTFKHYSEAEPEPKRKRHDVSQA
jgi:hypothetical protein